MERLWKNFAVNNVLFGDIQRHLMNRSDEFLLRESAGFIRINALLRKKHDKNCPIFCKVLQVWNKFDQSKTKKFLFCNEFDHLICSKLFFWIQDFLNANKFVDQRLKKSDRSSKIWLFDLIWLVIDFHIEYDQWSFASIVAFSIAFNLSHIEKSMI